MKAFHDSRSAAYRAPYGALELGGSVNLVLDVWDAPDATVNLRTWVDGLGESLYPMDPVPVGVGGESASPCVRYQATLTPTEPGVVWYQFIIDAPDGSRSYYGAQEGRFGGVGQMRGWEAPSFKLTVFDDELLERLDASLPEELDRPLADAVFGFLRGTLDAHYLAETVETLRENYPMESLLRPYAVFDGANCPDVIACLADIRNQWAASFTKEDILKLDLGRLGLAKGRLWCASLIQMLLPCEPLFPAPETGSEDATGTEAPFWDYVDGDCEAIVQNVLDLRRSLPLFTSRDLRCFAVNSDVVGIWRGAGSGNQACILVNRSLQNAHDVPVPMVHPCVSEIISGYGVPVVDANTLPSLPEGTPAAPKYAQMHLHQLGSAILYFHDGQQLGQPMAPGLGVLAHITSLPTAASTLEATLAAPAKGTKAPAPFPLHPGTLGAPARAFVDWLARAGMRYWQVLPVNPTDEYGSPYAGISAFAGNLRLLEEGTLQQVQFDGDAGYQAFCEHEADWLEPYAAFMAIRERMGEDLVWQEWPEKYRSFDPKAIASDPLLGPSAEKWRQAQYAFECQWRELKSYANHRGVQIIGDMPIYVSADSSDAWANPGIFQLDPEGMPAVIAGCPPDAFSEEGQVWGNPVYNWDALAADGFRWWLRRLQRAFELYDYVRLDHFIGFCRYYCIPAGEKATAGSYRPGPGLAFFQAAHKAFGPLPIIAEDLGAITPAVRALVAGCGFPGMDIVQFVDGNDPLAGYQPRPDKVAYTGTHDNQTLRGYTAQRYADQDDAETALELCEMLATCDADVRILPLQDVMRLGDEARMNTPGTLKGNWAWQASEAGLHDALSTARYLVQAAKADR